TNRESVTIKTYTKSELHKIEGIFKNNKIEENKHTTVVRAIHLQERKYL
ncbi:hypothetical protein DOY81_000465, partial [Sarcophaga bullata]